MLLVLTVCTYLALAWAGTCCMIVCIQHDGDSAIERSGLVRRGLGRLYVVARSFVLSELLIFLGLLAFVVPGIYIGIRLLFVPCIAATESVGVRASLKTSWQMTGGRFWSTAGLACLVLLVCLAIIVIAVVVIFVILNALPGWDPSALRHGASMHFGPALVVDLGVLVIEVLLAQLSIGLISARYKMLRLASTPSTTRLQEPSWAR